MGLGTMRSKLRLWSRTGIAASAALVIAATAAFAYDRSDDSVRSTVYASAEQADPGIDFMITGPAGPSKNMQIRVEASAPRDADKPVRRRMHPK